ncbi:hypothetical protein CLV50_2757 [Flavobacterium lindanitolerans]|uniref:4Fe-4S ferredoxin-type domain-containing protein n=2 Tax=Flavobacterium lindanitolerans TaxID=428988 RepID=A0A497U070_9FLAO|nr:hypothetical protein B0G92_2747 [Flavobacterium lindanitolerans]RLJ24040.1 hypothetical protein CLV50_2757 [Flavobacterium lindanitolerans]
MRKLYFMLLIIFGIFMMPESSYACNKSSQKKNCSKEITAHKKQKENCCDKNSTSHNCKGKCKHASCICPVSCVNAAAFFILPEFNSNLFALTEKRLGFYHTEAGFASGFHSIWQPPKIG